MDHPPSQPARGATTVDGITTDRGEPPIALCPHRRCLTILVHPDLSRVGEQCCWEATPGGQLLLSRLGPHFSPAAGGVSRPLEDSRISRTPLLLRNSPSGLELLNDSGRVRAQLDGRPASALERIDAAALRRGVVLTVGRAVALMLHDMDLMEDAAPVPGLLGVSGSIRRIWSELPRLACLDLPVLLTGESGVGKELVAQAIHRLSPRAERKFVAVNLSALPASTAAAELFGHARGAFTGAVSRRPGYFGEAEGSTLFLDEIGETPSEIQPMLLRAIESGEIQPLGLSSQRSNVRIVAATDADLEKLVASGRFRAALLHRLRATTIAIPPLRDRRQDIPLLLVHFLREALARFSALDRLAPTPEGAVSWLPLELILSLLRYPWPGNVRELRNVAYELALSAYARPMATLPDWLASRLEQLDLPGLFLAPSDPPSAPAGFPGGPDRSLETTASRAKARPAEISAETLRSALEDHDWRIGATAQALGISRNSLYIIMKEAGVVHAGALTSADILAAMDAEGSQDPARVAARLQVSERGLTLRMRALGMAT